ncbi:MAG: phosphohistidine phosphatase SixA [Bacteroidota bacterium]
MKLFILRHGEAEPGGRVQDFDRTLTARGRETVNQVGKKLSDHGVKFNEVLSSPSRRTRETANLVLEQIGFHHEVRFIEQIYDASLQQVLHELEGRSAKSEQVLLIGHNPSLSELADYLLGINYISLSPGQLMGFELAIESWKELNNGCGSLIER